MCSVSDAAHTQNGQRHGKVVSCDRREIGRESDSYPSSKPDDRKVHSRLAGAERRAARPSSDNPRGTEWETQTGADESRPAPAAPSLRPAAPRVQGVYKRPALPSGGEKFSPEGAAEAAAYLRVALVERRLELLGAVDQVNLAVAGRLDQPVDELLPAGELD
eukprot:scaffold8901_cov115-Isochrysis_galbana.AAC.2